MKPATNQIAKRRAATILLNCILLPFISLTILQCSHRKKIPPIDSPQKVKNQLERAKKFYSKGDTKKALSELHEIAVEAPFSDSADDAYMLMGESYYEHGQYEKAYKAYLSIIRSETHSPIEIHAYIGAIYSLNQLARHDEALSLSNQGLQIDSLTHQDTIKLREIKVIILKKLGDQIDALENLILLAQDHPDKKKQESYKSKAIEIVRSQLDIGEISLVLRKKDLEMLHPLVHLNAANYYYNKKKFFKSQSHIQKIDESDSEIYKLAQDILQKIRSLQTVEKRTIGVILPLTGKHSRHAYKTLRGLQLGLGIFSSTSRSSYKLAVIDSQNNTDTAKRAVQRLVTEDHVIAIVGGLLSKTAQAISSKANELGVPNISLSQKPGITEIGNYVFRNSLTSEMLVRHLVKIAMTQKNLKRFAIIYPNDPYGIEYANLFWDEVSARSGIITAAQTYNAKETDFNHVVKRLVGTFYLEDRQEEYKEALKGWMQKNTSPRLRSKPPKNLLKPIIDFDALFIPDNTRALGQIAPMLVYHDINNIPLLGTNLWNNSSLIKRGQRYVKESLFVDGFSLSDKKFKNSRFFHEYRKIFGEDPGTFASQAYDTALILKKIIDKGESSRVGVRNKLSHIDGFKGSLGTLKLNRQREFLRPITGFNVVKGQIAPLKE